MPILLISTAQVLGDNAFVFEEEDFLCVWRNHLLSRTCEVDMQLDFFVDNGDGYDRYEDHIRERAYSLSTWHRLLQEAGFELLAVYGDMTTEPPATRKSAGCWLPKTERDCNMSKAIRCLTKTPP